MIKILFALPFALTMSASAVDRDTLPLNQKQTSRAGSGEPGSLTQPAKTTFENQKEDPDGDASEPVARKAESSETKAFPYVASIETFGSSRINETIVREALGPELDAWLAAGLKGDPKAGATQAEMTERVKAKFGFPYAEWTVVQFLEPGDMAAHVTLDVVEKEDVARRMPFFKKPDQTFSDPDGLIKTWLEYERIALELVKAGKLEPESETCPAFNCTFAHKHAELKKYEPIFLNGVKKNWAKLLEIVAKDKRSDFRAAAVYLLAYGKEGSKVVSTMVDRIRDPEAIVRNNALRVLGDIAEFHQDLLIPVPAVLQALQFPRVSDRSKALYVLYLQALNSQAVREELTRSAAPTLITFLNSKQPDLRDVAHSLLRKISGKDFPSSDNRAWANWANRVSKERTPSNR